MNRYSVNSNCLWFSEQASVGLVLFILIWRLKKRKCSGVRNCTLKMVNMFHIGYDEEGRFGQPRQKIIRRLQEKIDESTDQPLYFIGHFPPTMQLQHHTFNRPVYFTFAKFLDYLNVSDSQFLAGADFSGS
jgi:hypothetical protein